MDYEEDVIVQDDERYDLKRSLFVGDIKRQAQECLLFFFSKKRFWAGGSINPSHLLNERAVKAVMETSIIDGIDIAYRSLAHNPPENWDTEQELWDVKLVHEALGEIARKGIPKCHAAGLLLVYLEQCHGVETLRRLETFNFYRQKLEASLQNSA